jgi:hypothetical protein
MFVMVIGCVLFEVKIESLKIIDTLQFQMVILVCTLSSFFLFVILILTSHLHMFPM